MENNESFPAAERRGIPRDGTSSFGGFHPNRPRGAGYPRRRNKTEKSFSLIEMIVAMAIFSLVLGSVIGIFVSAIRTQTETLALQKILDEASYSIEYMGRAIRMAKKDYNGRCVPLGANYSSEFPWLYIMFLNYEGNKCQDFEVDLSSKRLWKGEEEIVDGLTPQVLEYLTSDDFEVDPITFNLIGDEVDVITGEPVDSLQPRVTISFTVQKPDGTSKFQIQTTVSQRNLDI